MAGLPVQAKSPDLNYQSRLNLDPNRISRPS
ncbi:hypothetical protein F383_16842 [Gossypium arboreum]|uniref:Uncharacterized protein n=1 Tax=Gossypium arboreum TaxID=29729 RepID=A0A0B0NUH1_GOSAR|nr:hypothetical protein F383_16842 [Gossypium arboreum]